MKMKDYVGYTAKYQGGQSEIKSFKNITIGTGEKRTLVVLKDGTVLNYEIVKVKCDDGQWRYLDD